MLWKVQFTQQISPRNDGKHAHIGSFGKERLEDHPKQESYCIVGCAVIKAQKADKDQIHDGKHHQWLQNRPEIANQGSLITQFKICLD